MAALGSGLRKGLGQEEHRAGMEGRREGGSWRKGEVGIAIEKKSIRCGSGMNRIHVYQSTLVTHTRPHGQRIAPGAESNTKPEGCGWVKIPYTHIPSGKLRLTHPLCKQEHSLFKTCEFLQKQLCSINTAKSTG